MSSFSSASETGSSWKEWKNQNTKENQLPPKKPNRNTKMSDRDEERPKTPMPETPMDFGEPSTDKEWKIDDQDETDSTSGASQVDVIINQKPMGRGKSARYFHGFVGPGWKPQPKKAAKKRPADILSNELEIKKLKVTPTRPAIALMNEILPSLEYVCNGEGPPHNPSFTVTTVYPPENGKEFIGHGRSKKIAKNNVAERILESLGVELPAVELSVDNNEKQESVADKVANPNLATGFLNANPAIYQKIFQPPKMDFSSDDVLGTDFEISADEMSQPMIDFGRIRRLKNIQNFEENSCLALNALLSPQTVNYVTLGEEGPPHSKVFTVQCIFQDKTYIGKGASKRKAKANSAKQVLVAVLGSKFYQSFAGGSILFSNSIESVITPAMSSVIETCDTSVENSEYDLVFSDHIGKLVTDKFEELLNENETHKAQKVLAGVVMTTGNPMIATSVVIAVTTGTKCIEGDFMSESGLALNDCHAEILATRCVRDFLYSQVESFLNPDESNEYNIFEYDPNSEGEKIIVLKDGIRFHLFISTSPCGDSRIFSPKGTEAEQTGELGDTHPNRINRGVLRAKIEAGEGTIPVANLPSGPQTWDAIIQGNALHTMSCSDKVCRWNVLGFQGALLSAIIAPIYYSSVTLGSLHHPVHFRRAIIGRIESLTGQISAPFHVSQPHLLMVTCEQKRRVKKSPNHAIAWAHGWSTYEHISASKGRCEPGGVASRLTKRMAYLRFLKLYKNKSGKRENFIEMSYGDAKLLAEKYQLAKNKFKEHMIESKFGTWISKPVEQDSFMISK